MTASAGEINPEAFFKISYGLYIISSGAGEKENGFIANAVFQVTAEPPQFAICCSKDNYTASLIEKSEAFSISVLKKEAGQSLIALFGYKSGKDVNKFENVSYIKGITGTPIVTQDSLACFECRVVKSFDVGTHLLITGVIVSSKMLEDGEPMTYTYYRETRKGTAPKNAPTYISPAKMREKTILPEKHKCRICGYVYDPEKGMPDADIHSGTIFSDLPLSWQCPLCGADKGSFDKL